MMSLKSILLILIALVPAAVFLFLKIFGDNQYEIPVFYEEGVVIPECSLDVQFQFKVPSLKSYGFDSNVALQGPTLYFRDSRHDHGLSTVQEILRISNTSDYLEDINVVLFNDDPGRKEIPYPMKFTVVGTATDDLRRFYRCALIVKEEGYLHWLVLTDEENRIRGYYDGTVPDEYERLKVEVQILLQNTR